MNMNEENKTSTTYNISLKASPYDFLEVVQGTDGRITIKFLDTRWRTRAETIAMLKEVIEHLS